MNHLHLLRQQLGILLTSAVPLSLIALALTVLPGAASAQGSWSQVYHEDQHATKNIDLESVTYGNGRFVAVGHANLKGNSGNRQPMIMASSDGTSWTDVSPSLDVNGGYLWEVIHTGTQFVAVGNDNTKATGYNEETLILTSSDGLSWQRVSHSGLPLYNFWEDIAYGSDGNGNARYVLAADTSLYYSSDLVTWSEISKPTGTSGVYWNSVAYGNGRFVTVGKSGSGYVTARLVSSDGANWSIQATSDVGKDTVEFVNAGFVNIGVGTGTYTSSDTVSWEEVTPKLITATTLYSVDYANGAYVFGGGAVGTGNSSGYVWVTADFKNWWQERLNGVTEGGIRSLAHDGAGFVGVSDADGMIYYSAFSSAANAPEFTSFRSIAGAVGEPLTYTVSATGLPAGSYYYHTYNLDPARYSYQLPAGLYFSASSGVGVLSGTPTEVGTTALRFSIKPNSGVYVDGARAIEAEVTLAIGATAATSTTTTTSTTSTTTTTLPPGDTIAPTAPTGLTASASGATQVNLSWTASIDAVGVASYKVYRGGTLVTTLGNVTSYGDTGLSASTTYSYTVVACDAAGNCSSASAVATATTIASSTIGSSILFGEDFESYTPIELITNRNGWMGDAAYVNSGRYLSTHVLDSRYDIGTDTYSKIYKSLPRALSSLEKTVMSFDAYATTTSPISHNTALGLGIGGDGAKLDWYPAEETRGSGKWVFDARGVAGGSTDYQSISGGFDRPVSLKITIDGPVGEVYGVYDFGSGEQQTQHYKVTPTSIEALNAVYLYPDFRSPTAASTPLGSQYFGIELDNILIETSSGDIAPTATSTTTTTTTTTTSTTTTTTITTSDSKSDCLFDWAEATHGALFSPKAASMTFGPYYLRYYSQTNAYLAVTAGSLVYLGPLSDNKILDLGLATTWYATAGCN